MGSLLWSVLIDVAIVGGLYILGILALRVVGGRVDALAQASLGLGLGGGLLSWVLFVMSWVGVPLSGVTVVACFAALAVILLMLSRAIPGQASPARSPGMETARQARWSARVLWVVLGLLVLAAAFLAVGLSYSGWDDIAGWSVAGYGIALEGSVFGASGWGHARLLYPLNIPIQISIFRMLDGDVVPGSKLLFPGYYLALLLSCYRFWRARSVSRPWAELGTVLLASTPLVFTHATLGYTNLPFTFYLTAGLLWGIEGLAEESRRKMVLAGVLLAQAGWTRPEGYLLCLGVLVSLLTGAWMARRSLRPFWAMMPPVLLAGVTWVVFLRLYGSGSIEHYQDLRLALAAWARGQVNWGGLYTIARFLAGQVLRFREWGAFLPTVILLLIARLRFSALRQDNARSTLTMASLILGVAAVGANYVTVYSLSGREHLYTYLAMDFNRVFMPVGVCLGLLAFLPALPRLGPNQIDP